MGIRRPSLRNIATGGPKGRHRVPDLSRNSFGGVSWGTSDRSQSGPSVTLPTNEFRLPRNPSPGTSFTYDKHLRRPRDLGGSRRGSRPWWIHRTGDEEVVGDETVRASPRDWPTTGGRGVSLDRHPRGRETSTVLTVPPVGARFDPVVLETTLSQGEE